MEERFKVDSDQGNDFPGPILYGRLEPMAPFESKSQMRKFGELVHQGKMSQATFDEWLKATPDSHKLPERVHPQHPKIPKIRKVQTVKEIK